ncbi:hypothetical protein LJB42_001427 [Komagataella kurtzmanii]|nr:hypothetical protein LJB42_001427 [Komagataella kurtzmanii]
MDRSGLVSEKERKNYKVDIKVILNNAQGVGKHYKGLDVCMDGAADLSYVRSIGPESQTLHVDLCLDKNGEPVKVVICKNAPPFLNVEKVSQENLPEKELEKQLLKSSLSPLHGYEKCLFAGLDFSLSLGEKVTTVGDNGSGKTTFQKLISGIEEYTYSGSVVIEGRIAYLPQHFEDVSGDELAIVTLLKSLYDPDIDEF